MSNKGKLFSLMAGFYASALSYNQPKAEVESVHTSKNKRVPKRGAGLRVYKCGDTELYALNLKNAIRKFQRLNLNTENIKDITDERKNSNTST